MLLPLYLQLHGCSQGYFLRDRRLVLFASQSGSKFSVIPTNQSKWSMSTSACLHCIGMTLTIAFFQAVCSQMRTSLMRGQS